MKRRGLRNAGEFGAIIRRELLPKWRDRPISVITRKDAAKLIRDIMNRGGEPEPGRRRRMSGGPWAAHHAFAIAKTMFGWALDQDETGLTASPFDSLKPRKLIGPRSRVSALSTKPRSAPSGMQRSGLAALTAIWSSFCY
jgi:hypothetical protein